MGMEPRWKPMKGGQGQGNRKGGRLCAFSAVSFMVTRAKLMASDCHRGRGDKPLGTVFGGRLGERLYPSGSICAKVMSSWHALMGPTASHWV